MGNTPKLGRCAGDAREMRRRCTGEPEARAPGCAAARSLARASMIPVVKQATDIPGVSNFQHVDDLAQLITAYTEE